MVAVEVEKGAAVTTHDKSGDSQVEGVPILNSIKTTILVVWYGSREYKRLMPLAHCLPGLRNVAFAP